VSRRRIGEKDLALRVPVHDAPVPVVVKGHQARGSSIDRIVQVGNLRVAPDHRLQAVLQEEVTDRFGAGSVTVGVEVRSERSIRGQVSFFV
jgi:hypothetical protein